MKHFLKEAYEWAEGRMPFFRSLLLLFFLYIWIRHLGNPMYSSIFKGINLGIHEIGHIVFSVFGHFIMMAGGTILQCLAPVISIFLFYRQRDFFAIAICFGWLATNLFDVATYVADARAMALPLVSPFGVEAAHDWHYLLGELGILKLDRFLGGLIRIIGSLNMLICLIFGGWLLLIMFKTLKTDTIDI